MIALDRRALLFSKTTEADYTALCTSLCSGTFGGYERIFANRHILYTALCAGLGLNQGSALGSLNEIACMHRKIHVQTMYKNKQIYDTYCAGRSRTRRILDTWVQMHTSDVCTQFPNTKVEFFVQTRLHVRSTNLRLILPCGQNWPPARHFHKNSASINNFSPREIL